MTTEHEQTTIRIGAKELTAALAKLLPLVKESPIVPALSSVMMNGAGSQLTLTAGSDSQRMTLHLDGLHMEDDDDFRCCIEIKPLHDVLKSLPDVPVWIESKGESATISTSQTSITLPCFDPFDFPVMVVEGTEGNSLPPMDSDQAKAIGQSLTRLSAFMGTDTETFPQFAGIWFSPSAIDSLRLEACDGKFASDQCIYDPWTHDEPVLLPHDSVKAVAAMLDGSQPVTLTILAAWIGVVTDTSELWIRRFESVYPPFEKLWPKPEQLPTTWTVDKSQLVSSLRRITALPGTAIPGLTSKNVATHTAKLDTVTYEGAYQPMLIYDNNDYHSNEQAGDWQGEKVQWECGVDVKRLGVMAQSFTSRELFIHLQAAAGGPRLLFIEDKSNHTRAMLMASSLTKY